MEAILTTHTRRLTSNFTKIFGCALDFPWRRKKKTALGKVSTPSTTQEKDILSIKDFKEIIQDEISRVKSLTSTGLGYWLDYPQEKGQLFYSDPTTHLKGCSKNTIEKL